MSKKKIANKMFNPEKYHMNFCHECHGLGKVSNKDNSKEVCQVCGGFGLIKKRGSGFEEVGT
jgi:PHP family Zn ribbon phosphoesterase